MRRESVQHRTGRSLGKGAPARRVATQATESRTPDYGGDARASRSRRGPQKKRRRPLIFYAVAASVACELVAIVVDVEALVLLFSLVGLFLCTAIFRAAKI